jgi:hypothetical protein
MTALNLFTTKFDQVLGLVEKRADSFKYVASDYSKPTFRNAFIAVMLYLTLQAKSRYSLGLHQVL